MTFFEEIKQYVNFSEHDTAMLQALLPKAAPEFPRIADHYYERILAHPEAHRVITGGAAQVERLKQTLERYMHEALSGPHDEAYYEKRARIGRVHVQIGLPQHYMLTAMNVLRSDLRAVVEFVYCEQLDEARPVCDALDKVLDLDLAIMLRTYAEDSDERLRAHERLATIGQLAASIGHDLRNPLGVIESSLFILRRRVEEEERVTKHLDRISDQVRVCNRIVTDLLEMARNRPLNLDVHLARSLLEEAVASVQLPAHVEVHYEVPDRLELKADPGLIHQSLMNLIGNAVQAISDGGGSRITLSASEGEREVVLTVRDDGPGFPPDSIRRVFEPLFTTRAKGTGLGLALVKSIMDRHDGEATADNHPEGGAMVSLRLPRRPD